MSTTIAQLGRRLRLGVVGGGPGSFIGPVHRAAARLDDHYEVVAAVLSRDPERSRAGGAGPRHRRRSAPTATMPELLAGEAARADGIDAAGGDDPERAALSGRARRARRGPRRDLRQAARPPALDDALDLVRRVRDERARVLPDPQLHRLPDGPARPRDGAGAASSARSARSRSSTSRATSPAPTAADRDPAANWRFSGEQGGPSLVLGDIGTHAHHLASFVTGQELAAVAAEVGSAVPGRQVDDFAHLLLRFAGRRAGLDVGHQLRRRRRARPAHPGVRRQGRAGVAAGGPQPPAPPAARRLRAAC